MKKYLIAAVLLAAILIFSAGCVGGEKTPEEIIVGEWKCTDSTTQNGMVVTPVYIFNADNSGTVELRSNGISTQNPINMRWIYINEEETFGEAAKGVVYYKVIYTGLGAAADFSKYDNFFYGEEKGKEYLYSADGLFEGMLLVRQ